jgi:predicted nucleotidyltransferase
MPALVSTYKQQWICGIEKPKTFHKIRTWLIEKNSDNASYFGSCARNTKIESLEDIDIMVSLMAEWFTYFEV